MGWTLIIINRGIHLAELYHIILQFVVQFHRISLNKPPHGHPSQPQYFDMNPQLAWAKISVAYPLTSSTQAQSFHIWRSTSTKWPICPYRWRWHFWIRLVIGLWIQSHWVIIDNEFTCCISAFAIWMCVILLLFANNCITPNPFSLSHRYYGFKQIEKYPVFNDLHYHSCTKRLIN